MQIVDPPTLQPGYCLLTRTHKGPMVDTGVDIEADTPVGRVYVAESTVAQMAQMFGWLDPDEAVKLRAASIHYRSEAIAAHERAETLLRANVALVQALADFGVPAPSEHESLTEAIEAGLVPAEPQEEAAHG